MRILRTGPFEPGGFACNGGAMLPHVSPPMILLLILAAQLRLPGKFCRLARQILPMPGKFCRARAIARGAEPRTDAALYSLCLIATPGAASSGSVATG